MYGSHHQQPQKDCRYDELDPYLVVREPSMHMIEPIHGQPPSGYHAPPNPIHYHILGLTTNLEPYSYLRQRQAVRTVIPTPEPSRWDVLCSHLAAREKLVPPWVELAVGAPG